jgi:hypothetical protein
VLVTLYENTALSRKKRDEKLQAGVKNKRKAAFFFINGDRERKAHVGKCHHLLTNLPLGI